MKITVSKKQAEFLKQQGRNPDSVTLDDVRKYRKMPVTSSADEIAAHNAAINAKKAAKKADHVKV